MRAAFPFLLSSVGGFCILITICDFQLKSGAMLMVMQWLMGEFSEFVWPRQQHIILSFTRDSNNCNCLPLVLPTKASERLLLAALTPDAQEQGSGREGRKKVVFQLRALRDSLHS